jgi:hypothetical protein
MTLRSLEDIPYPLVLYRIMKVRAFPLPHRSNTHSAASASTGRLSIARARDDSGGQLALASGILEHSNFIPAPDQNCAIAQSPTHLLETTNFDPSKHHTLLPLPEHPHVRATASQQSLPSQQLTVSLPDGTRK